MIQIGDDVFVKAKVISVSNRGVEIDCARYRGADEINYVINSFNREEYLNIAEAGRIRIMELEREITAEKAKWLRAINKLNKIREIMEI